MTEDREDVGARLLDTAGLHRLVDVLTEHGYRVIGPTVRDNAIVLAELQSASDLPRGWGVEVSPGHYRLRRREDDAAFGHSAGPQSWKQFLHPPRQRMWAGARDGSAVGEPEETPRYAFLGVRGCDLAAIATLDRVLGRGEHPDNAFVNRRRQIFVVAVNCTEAGGLCFCASMGTGPAAGPGYDLALTERAGDDGDPSYVVEVGTPEGAEVLAAVPHRAATDDESDSARTDVANAAQLMGRRMPEGDLRNLLVDNRESPQWDEVASRCLTCGNCTMVCPTCFCTSTEDVTDLTGDHAERWREWASCFEFDFTFIHGGGSVRQSGSSRYRHWLTHKLGTWHDQFGMSGCVGCGRCIAWCPTGIDITAEMNKMAGDE
ncbi:MAG: 4Fe-4S dicluster domain-containing protein [Mycobacteriaceae bacterium]|nr:4Fe-4S dicluster domain-containing protein [Mycobacteriaceae bacterium]